MAVDILLVEDNPGDQRLTSEAFHKLKKEVTLHIVSDGLSALDFLYHRGQYFQAPVPSLIILDLNLPLKSGCEVLSEIKNDSDLRRIPVIMFSTSTSEQEIDRTYGLYANCYIAKPHDFDVFLGVVTAIEDFWLRCVELPNRSHLRCAANI